MAAWVRAQSLRCGGERPLGLGWASRLAGQAERYFRIVPAPSETSPQRNVLDVLAHHPLLAKRIAEPPRSP